MCICSNNKFTTQHFSFVSLYSGIKTISINVYGIHHPYIRNFVNIITNDDYIKVIFDTLNNWWKEKNTINNNKINKKKCYIKNANVYELNYINNLINSISQVKSNELISINLGLNLNEIIFYGDFLILSDKLLNNKIQIKIEKTNECIISSIN